MDSCCELIKVRVVSFVDTVSKTCSVILSFITHYYIRSVYLGGIGNIYYIVAYICMYSIHFIAVCNVPFAKFIVTTFKLLGEMILSVV